MPLLIRFRRRTGQRRLSCPENLDYCMLSPCNLTAHGIIEYAKTHEEIKGAFLTFQKDADQI